LIINDLRIYPIFGITLWHNKFKAVIAVPACSRMSGRSQSF
jgi:hypothetical protein